MNSDIADELGLQGRIERVKVNILNGQVEIVETKPINVELKSVTGKVIK